MTTHTTTTPRPGSPVTLAPRRIAVGDTVRIRLPWTEVCMHLRIAEQVRDVRILPTGAQVLNDDGTPFSAPITHAEAGIRSDQDGLVLPPEHDPEIVRQVATRDLEPGMRLLMPPPHVPYHVRVVRTVAHVAESGYRNHRDEPLVTVRYAEPADTDWGDGNSGRWHDTWPVLDDDNPERHSVHT